MVDIVLLFGKFVLLALVYLFLFAAVRTGVRAVRSGVESAGVGPLSLDVRSGPAELKGVRRPIDGPIVIGRSPDADLVINDSFVSSRHARVTPSGESALLEDLGSTNGTMLNSTPLSRPTTIGEGDVIDLGDVKIEVVR